MSFILDALKKADTERHLGKLPGLHSQTQPPMPLSAQGRPWWRRSTTMWTILTAGGLSLVAVLWYGTRQAPDKAPIATAGLVTSEVPTGRSAQPAQPAPPALAEMPSAIVQPAASQTSVAVATEIPVPPAMPKPVPVPKKEASPPPRPATAAEPVNAMTMADLPPQIRSELPAIAIGGSMYSPNPADRMLLVDKRMLREGDEVAPGLVLESILPKGAMLRYKGFLFRMSY